MNIGIIGSGNIGGALGPLWAKAGHQVCYPPDIRSSSRIW